MRSQQGIVAIMVAASLLLGCASIHKDSDLVGPLSPAYVETPESGSLGETLWGLFDVSIDPASIRADIVPLRHANYEVNVLKFLEDPVDGPFISITDLDIQPPLVTCTFGIQHPFPERPDLTIFSVRGILLTDGSFSGFENSQLTMSGPGELRLINSDGYTRWMNPLEFPYNGTIFRYIPGMLGDPNGDQYTSTLNPYKLFADSIDQIDDNLDLNESMKGAFTSGTENFRRYELDFGSQPVYKFQYAVLASWDAPLFYPPQIPDDFPSGTVADEPWRIEVEELNHTLYYVDGVQGGELELGVRVRDFENAHLDRVYIESPGIFPSQEMTKISQDGIEITFELEIAEITISSADPFDILVTAVAPDGEGYNGQLPGEELAMYVIHTVDVINDPEIFDCQIWPFYDDFESYNCVWTSNGGEWWGKADGYLDASGGGDCYEEDTGEFEHNTNISSVSSPPIEVPESDKDLILTFNHTIDVDEVEPSHRWAWDMVYVNVNGEKVFPATGPPYELNRYPVTQTMLWCWTGFYDWSESTFDLGTEYNGSIVRIEFVLDTYDYITNSDPPNFGWLIKDVYLDFAD